ncbi:uncharacterized protein [Palaemon carinicauda]|uniref:uncharacterized protein n=1 Tax=Palaemon carinicauda TaxID=392227 RepID=UPI0035B6694F
MRFDKYTFGAERVDYLGHQISTAAVKTTSTKVDTVKTFPTATTIWHLQEFLGCNAPLAGQRLPSPKQSPWCTKTTVPPLKLTTDASNVIFGEVLEQIVNGSLQRLALFSKKLKLAETRYSMFDRELLTVYLAIPHFKYKL